MRVFLDGDDDDDDDDVDDNDDDNNVNDDDDEAQYIWKNCVQISLKGFHSNIYSMNNWFVSYPAQFY